MLYPSVGVLSFRLEMSECSIDCVVESQLKCSQSYFMLFQLQLSKKQDRETRSMAVPEVTIYNLLLKPQAFSFECLYLKKTTGNLSIYVPQK